MPKLTPEQHVVSMAMADMAEALLSVPQALTPVIALDRIEAYGADVGLTPAAARLAVVGALRDAHHRAKMGRDGVAICPLCMPARSMRADEVESHLSWEHRPAGVPR